MSFLTWIRASIARILPSLPHQPTGIFFRIPHAKLPQLNAIQKRTEARSEAQVINDALTAWNYLTKKIEAGSVFWETTMSGEQLELDFVASVCSGTPPKKAKPHLYLVTDDEKDI